MLKIAEYTKTTQDGSTHNEILEISRVTLDVDGRNLEVTLRGWVSEQAKEMGFVPASYFVAFPLAEDSSLFPTEEQLVASVRSTLQIQNWEVNQEGRAVTVNRTISELTPQQAEQTKAETPNQ